ncbi:AraC family transcriptional regulator [Sphingomonas fuzhouensis]|uniref:AraC family transcriptional regulator n=1 Tax=Sphingomonas fuzhouensis TaxID=3106033 RepID=UPI002AFF623B|nr:AraC family transcriptional regulator [Sphingomonas sp. SGZ-02]
MHETHGILLRPEHSIQVSSDQLGWQSLYASLQHERPYEAEFEAVEDCLVILHLGGPVGVERRLGSKRERRVVPAGGLFILPGGVDFGVRLEGELDSLHIYLRRSLLNEVAAELGMSTDLNITPCLGEPDLLAEQLALGVRSALLEGDSGASAFADYLSAALAARLLRRFGRPCTGPECTAGSLGERQLRQVVDFMEARLDQPLSLADMASSCAMSASHFARRFKQTTGVPPHQYLIRLRIERAKRLLKDSMPIAEIAVECGFTHQEHLTSMFRRATGLTPAVFRRTARS